MNIKSIFTWQFATSYTPLLKKVGIIIAFVILAGLMWVRSDFTEIAAGVALFMFAMMLMENGFKAFTGGIFEEMLSKSTDRQWKSLVFGGVATTLMQSSTLVSLISMSFVSAQMMSLAGGIGIIMGANLGTTTGAWLIAGFGLKVDIAAYSMPILIFGMILHLQTNKRNKAIGSIMLGFAFIFLGIHFMKQGFETFQQGFDLSVYAIPGIKGLLTFAALGALMTVVMQSSHASLLLIIAALSANQISYENALALAVGTNLGGPFTMIMGALNSNAGAKRMAGVHVIFNTITSIIIISLFPYFVWFVDKLAMLLGIRDNDYMLKLAVFHTLFNAFGVALFYPLIGLLERFLFWLFQDKDNKHSKEIPKYLTSSALLTSQTALEAIKNEVRHLFDNAYGLHAHELSLSRKTIESEESLKDAVKATRHVFPIDLEGEYEGKVKSLQAAIIEFIAETRNHPEIIYDHEMLYTLRDSSRKIIASIKSMKNLHENLSQFAISKNPAVRNQYDLLRYYLAELLRELRYLLENSENPASLLALDGTRAKLKKHKSILAEGLDELVSKHQISAQMAISLMNDTAFMNRISKDLIEAVHNILLYARQAESALMLDLDEFGDIDEDETKSEAAKNELIESPPKRSTQ